MATGECKGDGRIEGQGGQAGGEDVDEDGGDKAPRFDQGAMWWLWGDVVAQLVKATGRHQTEDAAVPSSNPAPSTVS
jgi:hypothetical protein